jgi:heme-degrading monooxygenase HmoA
MVLEVALMDVTSAEAFAAAYAEAKQHLAGAEGLQSIRMTHGIESPNRFVLLVEWSDLAAHDAFRKSQAFKDWRGLLGPHFDRMPRVEHFNDV